MAEQGRVQYLIDILLNKKDFVKELKKINWAEILGDKGQRVSDLLGSEAQEAATGIKQIFGGIDWQTLLGRDDFVKFEKFVQEMVVKNRKAIKGMLDAGDTKGLSDAVEIIATLGDLGKELGASFDLKGFVGSITAMVKSVASIEGAADRIKTAFESIFNPKTTTVSARLSASLEQFSGDIEKKVEKIQRYKNALKELTTTNYELKVDDSQLETEFRKAEKRIDELYEKEEATGKKQTLALNRQYAKMYAIEKRRKDLELESFILNDDSMAQIIAQELAGSEAEADAIVKAYKGKFAAEREAILKEWKVGVEKTADQVKEIISNLEKEITENGIGKGFAKLISEQIANIQLQLTLNDTEKNRIVSEINQFIEDLNNGTWSGLKKINIGASNITTGFQELANSDEATKALAEMRRALADDTKGGIMETINQEIADAIDKRDKFLDKVKSNSKKDPRNQGNADAMQRQIDMLEQQKEAYKRFRDEIEKEDLPVNKISDLYFYYQQLENLEYKRNLILANTRKWREEMAHLLSFKGQELGLDLNIEQISKDALFQEIQNYFEENPINITAKLGQLDGTIDGANIVVNGGGGNIDATALAKAIQAAFTGDFSALQPTEKATEKADNGGKKVIQMNPEDAFTQYMVNAVEKLAGTYADKDNPTAKKVKAFFAGHGLNLEELQGKPAEIMDALEVVMEKFGPTMIDSFDDFIKNLGSKNKTLSVFRNDLAEMLRTYNIPQDTGNEAFIREESIKVFEDFLMRLDFRSGVNKMYHNIDKTDKWKKPSAGDVNELLAAANQMFTQAEAQATTDEQKERVRALWGGLINGRTEIIDGQEVKYSGLQDIMEYAGAATTPEDEEVLRQAIESFRAGASGVMRSLSDYLNSFDFTVDIAGQVYRIRPINNGKKGIQNWKKAQKAIKGDSTRINDVWVHKDPSSNPIGVMNKKEEKKLMYAYGGKSKITRQGGPYTGDPTRKNIEFNTFKPTDNKARKATENELKGVEEDAKAAVERREAANKKIVEAEKQQIATMIETDKQIESEYEEAFNKRRALRGKITKAKNKLDALGVTQESAEQANTDLDAANKSLQEAQQRKRDAEQGIEIVSTTLVPDWEKKNERSISELAKYQKWQKNPNKYAKDFNKEYTNAIIKTREDAIRNAQAEQQAIEARIKQLEKNIEYNRKMQQEATQSGDIDALNEAIEIGKAEQRKLDEAKYQLKVSRQTEVKAEQEIQELRENAAGQTEEARAKWMESFKEYTKRQIAYYKEETKKNGEDPRKKYQTAAQQADKDIAAAQAEVDRISSSKEIQAYQLNKDIDQASEEEKKLNARISGLEAQRERNNITHADILAKDGTKQEIDNIEARIGELEKQIEVDNQERKALEEYVEKNYKDKKFNADYTQQEAEAITAYSAAIVREGTLEDVVKTETLTSTPVLGEFSEDLQRVITSLFESREQLQALTRVGFNVDASESDLKNVAQTQLNRYNNGAAKIIDDLLKDSTGKGGQTIEKLTQFLTKNQNIDVQKIIEFIGKKSDKQHYKDGQWLVGLSKEEEFINSFLNNNEDIKQFLSNEQVKSDSQLSTLLQRSDKDKEIDAFVLGFAKNVVKQGQEFVKTQFKSIEDNISNQLSTIQVETGKEESGLSDLKAKAKKAETKRVKRNQKYIKQSLQTVEANNQKIKELEDPKEIALLLKENEDLLKSISAINNAYKKAHEDADLLDAEQLKFFKEQSARQYQTYLNTPLSNDAKEMSKAQQELGAAIQKRNPLLTNRKATLLDEIRTATAAGESTKELEAELAAINEELSKYELYIQTLANHNLADVFANDNEFAQQYIKSLAQITTLENEVDLMRAKGASQQDVDAKLSEINAKKEVQEQLIYSALQKRQQALLAEITNATKDGKSTSELQDKLKVVNRQLVDLELNARRLQDSKIGGIIHDADVRVVKEYNIQMRELIKKEQELALVKATGKNADEASDAVRDYKKRVENNVAEEKERVAIENAENSAKAQGLKYLSQTDKAVNELEKKAKAIDDAITKKQDDLAKIQSEHYQTSHAYRTHIDEYKTKKVQEYKHSDDYKADREAGKKKIGEEMAAYVSEWLANIGAADPTKAEADHIWAQMASIKAEYLNSEEYKEHENFYKNKANADTAAQLAEVTKKHNEDIQAEQKRLEENLAAINAMDDNDSTLKAEMSKVRGNLDLGKMKENFAQFFTAEIRNSLHQGTRQGMVRELRSQLKSARQPDSGASKEEIAQLQAKHDLYNTDDDKIFIERVIEGLSAKVKESGGTEADASRVVEFLRNMNPNQLPQIYDWFDKLIGEMGSEPVSEDTIRKEAKKNLKEQEKERVQKAQDDIRKEFERKQKSITGDAERDIDRELTQIVYEHVLSTLTKELTDSDGLGNAAPSFKEKTSELWKTYVDNLVSDYAKSLHVEDMVIDGENIREMVEQTVRNELAVLEELKAENDADISKLQANREEAKKFGNIGYGEMTDADIRREQVMYVEQLTAAKEEQAKLEQQIVDAKAAGDKVTEEKLRTQLRDAEARIDTLQMRVDNRTTELGFAEAARAEEEAKNAYNPEQHRLWLLDVIEKARLKLASGDENERNKAQADIDRWTQKLQRVEEIIAKRNTEKETQPKGLIDQIADRVAQRTGGGGGVSIDGATDVATETTLRAIFDVLTGSDEAAGAELDKRKAAAMAETEKWRIEHPATQSGDRSSSSRNNIGETSDAIKTAREYGKSLKDVEDLSAEIKKIITNIKTMTAGTKEYVTEQLKLQKALSIFSNQNKDNAEIPYSTYKKGKNKGQQYHSYSDIAKYLGISEEDIKLRLAERQVKKNVSKSSMRKDIMDLNESTLSGAIANGIEAATGTTRTLIAVDEADYKKKTAYINAVNEGYDIHNRAFAERAYYRNATHSAQKTGYYSAVQHPNFIQNEGIHSHPTNNAYSSEDIELMLKTRLLNPNYNVDRLITPNFAYELKGLANAPVEALKALTDQFKLIDSVGLPEQLEDIVTNSALYHFAQQSGVQYFKGRATGNPGEYADVTMSTVVPQETLDNLLKYIEYGGKVIELKKKIAVLEEKTSGPRDSSDLNSYIEMAVLERYKKEYAEDDALRKHYKKAAQQNPMVWNAFKDYSQNKAALRDKNEMMQMQASSTNLIQTALGRGWDMKLLYSQLEDYVESTEFLSGEANADSLLGKIKAALITAKDASVMNEILPLLKQYFGDAKLNYVNDDYLDDILALADTDPTGKIAQDLKRFGVSDHVSKARKKKTIVENDVPADALTHEDLDKVKKQTTETIKALIAEWVQGGMSLEEAIQKADQEVARLEQQMQNMQERTVATEEVPTSKKRGRPKKTPVEPEINPGAVAAEVKENVAETPATAEVKPAVVSGSVKDIISGITDQTKGTVNSFDALIGKFKQVPNAQKMLQELRDLMIQIPSATGDTKNSLIEQTTAKVNELIQKLVGLKTNRLADLSGLFGKDVQSDATHLLGVMKQIFEVAQKTRAEKDAQKTTEAGITQENKTQAQVKKQNKTKTQTDDKKGGTYNAFKDGAKVYSGQIAQEATLQKILAKLNAGVTTTGGGSKSTGGNASGSGTKASQKSRATNKYTRAAETQNFNIIGATYDEGSKKSILDRKDLDVVNEYNVQYAKLFAMQNEFNKSGATDDEASIKALRTKSAIVKELGKEVLATHRKTQELNDAVEQSGTYVQHGERKLLGGWSEQLTSEQQENIPAQLRQFAQAMYGANLEGVKINKTTGKLTGALRLNNYEVQDIVVQYDKCTKSMAAFAKGERESLSGLPGFWKGIKEKTKSITQYVASMTSLYRIIGIVRQGIQYIKEIDAALTELKKVTDETQETYDAFLKTASGTAFRLGSTLTEVTNATAEFAKLGYSMEMAAEMGEAALVYANVGDGISDAKEAADSIISTLKGFKLEAKDAMAIVDKFNEIGNKFAITSKGVGDALMKSASALSVAGNTIDDSIALITAANEVVQDPESVGEKLPNSIVIYCKKTAISVKG